MMRRCEHFTEIFLDDSSSAVLGGLWLWMQVRECVEDLSRVILKIEATGDKAAAQALLRKYAILTPQLQRAFSHLEDVQVFSAPPLDYCNSTFRDMKQRYSDFLTTKPASWKVVLISQWKDQVLWHFFKPLIVALIVCKNLTINIMY
jgi:hypothetical protein